MEWYVKVLQNYANFSGRARAKEYWMFFLINCLISIGLSIMPRFLAPLAIVSALYSLALFIPSLAAGVRRMHDTNHSGWFLLVPIYGLVLACRGGDRGENRYGPDPISGRDSQMGPTPVRLVTSTPPGSMPPAILSGSERMWFYSVGNQQLGPVTESMLFKLASEGKVSGETPIWSEGMSAWQPAKSIFGGNRKAA